MNCEIRIKSPNTTTKSNGVQNNIDTKNRGKRESNKPHINWQSRAITSAYV